MILITQPRVGTSHNEILALQMAARELGWEVYSAETSWRLPDELINSGKEGVPYGSQLFCEAIAQQMGWELIQNSFDWLARVEKVDYKYIKRKVEFMTLGEAVQLKETKFIKPADDKVFPCKVYSPGELIIPKDLPDNTPTLVSDPVQFDLEYRCFVKDKHVATWSNYVCYDNIADPRYWKMMPKDIYDMSKFLGDFLFYSNDYLEPPHPTLPSVVDVGRIPGKGWAIIETNPAWASGLYGCEPEEALKVMAKACQRAST